LFIGTVFSLYVKIETSPFDQGLEQEVFLLKELSNTPEKGSFLHTAGPIKKARPSLALFLNPTGHQRVALRAPQTFALDCCISRTIVEPQKAQWERDSSYGSMVF
jgi:hypothetical protein